MGMLDKRLNKKLLDSVDTSYQVFFVTNKDRDLVVSSINWPLYSYKKAEDVDTLDYLVGKIKELVLAQQNLTIPKADIYGKTQHYFKRAYKLDFFLRILQDYGYIHLCLKGVSGRKQMVVLNTRVLFQ